MAGLIFIVAVVGAIVDWRYVRAGGVRPSASDKRNLVIAILISVSVLAVFGVVGFSSDPAGERAEALGTALGHATAFLTAVVFGLWEFRRWRVRRAHPVASREKPDTSK